MPPDTAFAELAVDVKYIKEKLDKLEGRVDSHFVTQNEFTPVRNIAYGLVGLIVTSVIVALIGLVVAKG
jgi:ABC-type phosphate transport system permease subunit